MILMFISRAKSAVALRTFGGWNWLFGDTPSPLSVDVVYGSPLAPCVHLETLIELRFDMSHSFATEMAHQPGELLQS